ncbi:ABC transporter substrate-binding protein [Halalkalibacter sp. APA_J-10(15)]|uniref:ABC transporter substrate-binding protein n=1 Tax=Halalkalibacter sp. APA_J-10(15) TaxID=2933805 RepID=UPI001FF22E6D|nr:ABC transporter substrate-binding protein [Halalkalibacter sp. APA_J-10(15)]MCK0470203.1 ABC transporter substrate-binding protein [Halalkalibacter sp. APA_J-10(15)]
MIKQWLMAMILMLGLVLTACGSAEDSQTDSETNGEEDQQDQETEQVDSEEGRSISGEVQFYTSQPDADAEQLVSTFNELHPDVQVTIFRSGTEEVISKILAEQQAGDIQADVLLVADAVTFESLKEQELLLAYESDEFAHIPDEFIDSDHMYAGTKVMATVLAVNTNDVAELPTSWHAVNEDDANGEVIMPSPLYSGAAAYNVGVFSRQGDFGWEFFENLSGQDVTVVQGNGAVLQAVAGGEQAYGMVVDFIVARAKAEGSPIELIYPEEGVPVITEPIGIMNGTDNEEASKAFVDFVLSEQGQQMAADIGYTPIREGIMAPEGLKTIDEMDVLTSDVADLLSTREEDKQRFVDIFGE